VYVLKSILHNWDDAACSRILANCRRGMRGRGKLVIVERLMPEVLQARASDAALARSDLNMLVGLGGRERTLRQMELLLSNNGFGCRVLSTSFEFSLIEAGNAK
jgi:orsellinic acid C2-O-methyltransferase